MACNCNEGKTYNISMGCCTSVVANAYIYYTKSELDDKLKHIEGGGVTREEAQEMIDESIISKADKTEVNELAEQVRQNAQRILNTYTKTETDSLLQSYLTKLDANALFAKYAAVNGNTLSLNNEEITV